MRSRSPHLLPGQSEARRAQLLSSSPLESWQDEIARGGVFSADKLAALFLALGLFFSQLGFIGTPAAEAATSTYRDDFSAVAFDGTNGTIDWSSLPWAEGGENDGPGNGTPDGGGQLAVVADNDCGVGNTCLQIKADSASVFTLTREVDLSAATSATLTFDYYRRQISLPNGAAITLEISDDGGVGWDSLAVFVILSDDGGFSPIADIDLSAYSSPNALLRFRTDGSNLQAALLIDNLQVEVTTPDANVALVNSTADSADNNAGDDVCNTGGTNAQGAVECTLRAAIEEANASGTVDSIQFKIPQSDGGYSASPERFTIEPSSLLPEISTPMTIDGSTQPEFATHSRPVIEINGQNVSIGELNGLWITGGGTTIRSLAIHRWNDDAIELDVLGGNTIVGNYIGLNVDGVTTNWNGWGIAVKTGGNTIGGTPAADRNFIAGNSNYGLSVYNGGTGNLVQGNYIGVTADGTAAAGNGGDGVLIEGGASSNTIGGTTAAHGNVISGNGAGGVVVKDATTSGNIVRFNTIGTNAAGTGPVANTLHGIRIDNAPNTQVLDNQISGNLIHGVYVNDTGSTGTQILRNTIGTNATQTAAVPNLYDGIRLEGGSSGTVIGSAGNGNVISGNAQQGITINDNTGTTIQGNYIGTDSAASEILGNGGYGVFNEVYGSSDNLIGGIGVGDGNVIAHNDIGVLLTSGTNNAIVGNAIYSNTNLGIDIGDDGITPNGAGDPLDFPTITSATESGGTVTVDFTLTNTPDGSYRLEFFGNTVADGSGNGEGEVWAGSVDVAVTGGTPSPASTAFSGSAGDIITATATEGTSAPFGATSEFSAAYTVTGGVNNPPSADAGGAYALAEGEQLGLDGSGSSDPDTDPLTYAWDLDNDGQYDDATGETPTVSWLTLQGLGFTDDGGPYPVGLEVDDGTATDTAATTFSITNTGPDVVVSGSGSAAAGTAYAATVAVVDPGDDTVAWWNISWGDGTSTTTTGPLGTVNHTYAAAGYYNITAAVIDEDGYSTDADLFVPSWEAIRHLGRYDGATGAFEAELAAGTTTRQLGEAIFGPDGYLYVSSYFNGSIARFDPATNAFHDYFTTTGVTGPLGLTFGPDGNLYVSDWDNDLVRRYNGSTGADMGTFASGGGLVGPAGLTFGPDGNLWVVSNFGANTVIRYDGSSGTPIGVFTSVGGTEEPEDIEFGPDGNVYVAFTLTDRVGRFDVSDGTLLNYFVQAGDAGLDEASGIEWGPDGDLYVSSRNTNEIKRYLRDTGVTVGNFVSAGAGGLTGPLYGSFLPDHQVVVSGCADSDGDGLCDVEEDWNTDADNDPATNPGPNTDGDANPNYLDDDDDGDGTPTASENPDPNSDGDPRDAVDSDWDGQPDYLDAPTTTTGWLVAAEQKISDLVGGFGEVLADSDDFGYAVDSIGDLDGDGTVDLVASAWRADDGGNSSGEVHVLFLNPSGSVKAEQKISSTSGGLAPLPGADRFGAGVAGIGDLDGDGIGDLAVGADLDDDGGTNRGAVYILFLNTDGTVRAQQKISDTAGGFLGVLDDNDQFGRRVAVIGDLDNDGINDIVVGANRDDDAGTDRGAAYVLFLNDDGTVKAEQKISDSAGGLSAALDDSDWFGRSLAGLGDLDGDGTEDILVGASGDDDGGDGRGAAYVLFLNTNGTVKAEQKISDTSGGFGGGLSDLDGLGWGVASVGDLDGDGFGDVALGAPDSDRGGLNRGAVFVALLQSNGTVKWTHEISAASGGFTGPLDDDDSFGASVTGLGDLDGDGTIGIAVGAFQDDDGGTSHGAVYVLDLTPLLDSDGDGLWDHEEDANTDADNDPATNPGPNTDGDANPNYLDADDDGDGTPTASENPDPNSDGDPRDAKDADRDGEPDYLDLPTILANGAVAHEQLISETDGGLTTTLGVSDHFGRAVAPIGDLDGDGINDLAVGVPNDDDGSSDRGAVFILFMNADGTVKGEQKISDTLGGFTAVLDNADEFGIAVTGLGDLDGDLVPDIAVGSHQDDDGLNGNGGAVYVLFMNTSGTVKSYQKISETEGSLGLLFDANDRFGGAVANIGDLNGDGINDLAVGAKDDDDGFADAGAVYVLFLNQDGTVSGTRKISQTTGGLAGSPLGGSDGFGIGVAGLGDVDGDGLGDIAVGSYWDDDGGTNHGAAYVLFLNADGTVKGQQKISDTAGTFTGVLESNDEFGTAVGALGDVDADGVPDLIVGTPKDDDGSGLAGAAYVLFLNTNGTVKAHQKISNLEGGLGVTVNTSDQFGFAVAGIGDLDGNGTIGVAVGAFGDDDGFVDSGSVYILDLGDRTYVVNSTDDDGDNNVGDGVCNTGQLNSASATECTLRAAIEEANVASSPVMIEFDMPVGETGHSGGVWTISPGAVFDQLIQTVIIDGRTQPGWASTPVVEINGAGAGAGADGFRVAVDNVEIRGLAVNRFLGDGIEIASGAADTVISHNHIGVDATGLVDRGNAARGIDLGAGSGPTTVGGPDAADRNVISGNGGDGIIIWNSNANTIFNNYIGTDVTGLVAIGNGADGVALGGTSASNLIGQVGDLNVISGNVDDGVENDATGANNAVYYNIIGLGMDADTLVPNGRYGVVMYNGANNTFVYQNLIAGNTSSGVVIDGNGNAATTANNVIGNWIGLNLVDQPRPNGGHGVHIFGGATSNVIGGTPAAYRNIISGNAVDGIHIAGAATSGNQVENNHIGTNIGGDAAVPNGDNGIRISGAPNNTVGGNTVNHRNVVSGNGNNGILLDAATATGNIIQGNYFGLNAAGDAAVPNIDEGVDLSDAPGNLVGGSAATARNVISGNGDIGVLLIGAGTIGNTVSANYIGTNAAGDAPIANGRSGVYIEQGASSNAIGGPTAGHRNIISGNVEDGIYMTSVGTTANTVTSNYVGTNAAGNAAIPNGDRGVQIESGASGNFVGVTAQGNVISGNTGDGVIVADFLSLGTTDNEVVDNLIGVSADGTTPLGNGANGVHLDPVSDTLIQGNTIANNGQDGVVLETVTLAGNSIVGNSIYGNGQLGIDIGNNNVDTNDPLDGDGGANEGMNYPEPTNATETGGTVTFNFDLDVPIGTYWIDVFANPNGTDLSGNGEGELWRGGDTITSAGSGTESFSIAIAGSAGDVLTATTTRCVDGAACTDPGSTSEFSVPITVVSDVFVVNSTGDADDANPGNGVCDTGGTNTQGAAECTIRAAIREANAIAGASSITFDMPATELGHIAGVWTISPVAALPTIGLPADIDATTQTGYGGQPIVRIDGNSSVGVSGFTFGANADASTLAGVMITRFDVDGIVIAAGSVGVSITDSWIGSDGTGNAAAGNGDDGIDINGGGAIIDSNVVNHNGDEGIDVRATGVTITGSIVGLEADGASGTGNGDVGIAVFADGATIGGATIPERNVISSNFEGIEINSSNNVVEGNYIGTDSGGTLDRGNHSDDGVEIQVGTNNRIGGPTSAQANRIAFNQRDGVYIVGGSGSSILRNIIHDNGGLGIDLGPDGVTPNGAGDPLNFPVIDSAVIAPPWITVSYTIDAPAGDYVVEFFSNPSGTDPTGYGEGEAFEYRDAIAHPGGSASYVAVFSGFITDVLTATLTEDLGGSYGSTSEFSGTANVTAGTLVVNSGGNSGDLTPGDAACDTGSTITGGDPECTLDAAVQEANTLGGSIRIEFAIPDTDPLYRNLGAGLSYWRIQPTVSIAPITGGDITIDATTQTGYATSQGYFVNDTGPEVEINNLGGAGGNGLELQSGNNEIRGLAINRFATGIAVLAGSGNVIAGNYLGPDPGGANGMVGNDEGIYVYGATNTTIGGTAAADRNVISGNRLRGIFIDDFSDGDPAVSNGTQIIGNYVGTNAAGTASLPYNNTPTYQQIGLAIWGGPDNVIGTAAGGNVFSGNSWYGVYIWGGFATNNKIQGNIFGLDVTGAAAVPNAWESATRSGVYLSNTPGNLIGGVGAGEGNIIASNDHFGVIVQGASAIDNSILSNEIYGNVDLGIELELDGVTPNDGGDVDNGANDLLNHPVITSATETAGTVTLAGTWDMPAGWYRIETFTNTVADDSGYGEGESITGSSVLYHDGAGPGPWGAAFSGSVGDVITATATECTDSGCTDFNSTSEFSAAVTVTLQDTTAPVITLVGANPQTIEIGSAYTELGATALDDVDGDITGSIVIDATAVNTAVPGSYLVTYDVSDAAGNPAIQVTRTVDVVDTTVPVLTLLGSNPMTIEVGGSYPEPGATASDNYDGDITGSIVINSSAVNTAVVGSYVVTYDVADSSGNPASGFRTVDVVDTTLPVIALTGANPQTLEVNTAYVELGATASDNYDGDLTGSIVIDASAVDMSAVGSYVVIYDVTDSEGNAAVQVTRTVDVVDTTDPVITLVGANPQTIEVGSPYAELGATASDNYDGDLTGSIVIDASAVNMSAVGSYVVTYDVTDSEGNPAIQVTRTVDVVDTTIPVITLVGPNPQTIEVGSPYAELGATATDNYDGDLTGSIVIDAAAVNTAVVGSYPVTYNVTDGVGNPAVQVTRTVDVVDTTVPVITLAGANPQVIEVGSSYVELGATATDNYDGDLTGSIVIDASAVNMSAVGSYVVTYDVTDGEGNPAIQATRTVDVVDTTIPVITLVGANPQTIGVGSPYVELGATAMDNYDGDLTGSIVIDAAAINTAVVGSYVVTYDVADSEGNPAVQVTRTVDVVDTTAPIITLIGANPQTIEVGSPYVELGATATDNLDGDLTGSIMINSSAVNTAVVGSYVVAYDVTDSEGNPAVQVTRIVDVVDTTIPVITLIGASPQTIEVGSPYVELGATATDNYDGDLTGSIVINAAGVNTAAVGSYVVAYDVTDGEGNPATRVTRTVDVVDTTIPVITLAGANPQTIEVGSPYVELGATATDNYEGDLTGSIVINAAAVNTAIVGSYIVTYDVADSSGNPASGFRIVNVVDTTAPIITLLGTNPQTIEVGSPYVELGATASDNYDGDLTGSILIDASAVDTAVVGSYSVTYDVIDSEGNPAIQVIRLVDVVDTTRPVISLLGSNPQTIEVGSPYVELGATASDNYDGDLTGSILINASAVDTAVVGSYSVTYDVTDSEGNPAIQVIRTVDVANAPPTLGAIGNQTIAELTTATFNASATDPDATDPLVFSISGAPAGATIDPVSGVFSWMPTEAQGPGVFMFAVVVTDGGSPALSDTQLVTITVTEVNLQPSLGVIAPQPVDEQTPLSFVVPASDPDVPLNGLVFILSGAPAGATIDPASGTFAWTPTEAQGPGVYSFDIDVTDNGAPPLGDSQAVTVTVAEINLAPSVTNPGSQSSAENETVSLPIAATDSDVPANNLTYTAVGLPTGLTINPATGEISGLIDYSANVASPFATVVTVTDNGTPVRSSQVAFAWAVADTNRAPAATDDTATVAEDASIVVDVLANDSDPDGDSVSLAGVGIPAHGSASIVGNQIVYAPAANYFGADAFTYSAGDGRGGFAVATLDVNITPVNDAPVPSVPATLAADELVSVGFVATATDLEGDSVTFSLQGAPPGASIDPTGIFVWTPTELQGPGSYTFSVVASDDGVPVRSTARQVNISVAEVNSAPVLVDPGTQTSAEADSVSLDLVATDRDVPVGTLHFSATGLPPGLSIDPTTGLISGSVTFEAAAGSPYNVVVTVGDNGTPALTGSAAFTWRIIETNRAPTANDLDIEAEAGLPATLVLVGSDPDGDPLSYRIVTMPTRGTLTGGPRMYTYTPDVAAVGVDTFTFAVSDGSVESTGTVTVAITPNHAPIGRSDEFIVRRGGLLTVSAPGLLGNDRDPEGRPIVAVIDTLPAYGSVVLGSDGGFTYENLGDAADLDTFRYLVEDGMRESMPIDVRIIIEENVAPVAASDIVSLDEDEVALFSPLLNDEDPNDEPVTVVRASQPESGTIGWTPDGEFTYTPRSNWNGVDSFTYDITDGDLTGTATVTLIVAPVNDAPRASTAAVTGSSGEVLVVDLRPHASDVDGDPLTFLLEAPPSGTIEQTEPGVFSINLDGVIQDLPPLAYVATDVVGARATALLKVSVRIPAELVGAPALVSDDSGRSAFRDANGNFDVETADDTTFVAGLRLMVGSVLGTFRAIRVPSFVLLFIVLASLYLGLSRRFAFTSSATVLPLGSKKRVDIVMALSQAGTPVRAEPGTHQSVVHRFGADEVGIVTTGARSMVRSEVWVEVETPEGDAWINSEFITEQVPLAVFVEDDRPRALVGDLVDRIYESGDLLPATGGHDLHVAYYGPPVRFSANSLKRLLAGASVYWWWGPSGDAPNHQSTFAETVGESVTAAYRNRGAHQLDPSFDIPIEFINMHSLVVGNRELGEGWRIFFRYEDDEPSIAGLMREAAPNPAALHGMTVREPR